MQMVSVVHMAQLLELKVRAVQQFSSSALQIDTLFSIDSSAFASIVEHNALIVVLFAVAVTEMLVLI
jgi:hypothetical protein